MVPLLSDETPSVACTPWICAQQQMRGVAVAGCYRLSNVLADHTAGLGGARIGTIWCFVLVETVLILL
jgi:hypothetical protein